MERDRTLGRLVRKVEAMVKPPYGLATQFNWILDTRCTRDCIGCGVKGLNEEPINIDDIPAIAKKISLFTDPDRNITFGSLLGGELTLFPDLLLSAIEALSERGIFVAVVTNGDGLLNHDGFVLIKQMAEAGCNYINLSIDSQHHNNGPRHLNRYINIYKEIIRNNMVGVANCMIDSQTKEGNYIWLARSLIRQGVFFNPMMCSPQVYGAFSQANEALMPTQQQLDVIMPELIRLKFLNGRIATSASTLFEYRDFYRRHPNGRWHCSHNFHISEGKTGRTFFTVIGRRIVPCQELTHNKERVRLGVDLLDTPPEQLTFASLNEQFYYDVAKCPGCAYSCYITAETRGLRALLDLGSGFRLLQALGNGSNFPRPSSSRTEVVGNTAI